MSTHLNFDDSPHLAPRDRPYDLGLPLGSKATFPYIPPSGLDTYMGGGIVGPSTFSIHPSLSFNEYPHHSGGLYPEHYVPATQITLLDARPNLQEPPSPHQTDNSHFLFPPPAVWPEPEHHRASLDNSDPPHHHYYQHVAPVQQVQPSATPYSQTSWPVAEAQPATHTQPQPSWTMSGSLDPTTGVFQRAPEHPRVRTAQACEKCRVRKAKCSGEHPTCQRCRNRGLECKYAPERKMRGPNKVKRKGTSPVEAASGRRTSFLSSASGSSSDERGHNPNRQSPAPSSPFTTTPRRDMSALDKDDNTPTGEGPAKPAVQTNFTFQLPSPTPVSGYTSDDSPRLRKVRPPPLDLSRTSLIDRTLPTFHDNQIVYPISPPGSISTAPNSSGSSRRSSLPSYLLESYSRIALAGSSSSESNSVVGTPQSMDSSDATETQYPHPSYPLESSPISVYSAPRSNSSSASMSTPITPITLTSSFHSDLDSTGYSSFAYPPSDLPTLTSPYLPTLRESTSSDLGNFGDHFGSVDQLHLSSDHWGGLHDETPTGGSDEKILAQLASDMVAPESH